MANTIGKKYITDENGEKFYPIGNTGAIYDNSGNTLDTVLSNKASGSHTHTKSEITDFPPLPTTTLNGSSTTSASWYAPTSGVNSTYGGVLYSYSGGAPQWTAAGTSGYFLKAQGSGSAPLFSNNISANLSITSGNYLYSSSYTTEYLLYTSSYNHYFGYNSSSSTMYNYFGRKNSSGTTTNYFGYNAGSSAQTNYYGYNNNSSYTVTNYFGYGNTNTYIGSSISYPVYMQGSTSYKVVGTTTGYNTKIHVSTSDPNSTMNNGDLWFKLAS